MLGCLELGKSVIVLIFHLDMFSLSTATRLCWLCVHLCQYVALLWWCVDCNNLISNLSPSLLPIQAAGKYTAAWRAHVWAHLPFYTILLPAFLELSYSQTAYSSRMALNNVYRVRRDTTVKHQGMGGVHDVRRDQHSNAHTHTCCGCSVFK